MLTDLFGILGSDATSTTVKATLKSNGLTVARRSPPSRVYYSAPAKGLEVLAKNDQISSLTVFIISDGLISSYSDELPFGISKQMDLKQIKRLLGKPSFENDVTVKFDRPNEGVVVAAGLDNDGTLSFLQFTKLEAAKTSGGASC